MMILSFSRVQLFTRFIFRKSLLYSPAMHNGDKKVFFPHFKERSPKRKIFFNEKLTSPPFSEASIRSMTLRIVGGGGLSDRRSFLHLPEKKDKTTSLTFHCRNNYSMRKIRKRRDKNWVKSGFASSSVRVKYEKKLALCLSLSTMSSLSLTETSRAVVLLMAAQMTSRFRRR